mmetsp:Transcript_5133/g.12020  ORF Transcript_5133/g.12020 Transcript_5133/m.12020 type:complete len:376 (+) Transcript_5133:527-1654(+)
MLMSTASPLFWPLPFLGWAAPHLMALVSPSPPNSAEGPWPGPRNPFATARVRAQSPERIQCASSTTTTNCPSKPRTSRRRQRAQRSSHATSMSADPPPVVRASLPWGESWSSTAKRPLPARPWVKAAGMSSRASAARARARDAARPGSSAPSLETPPTAEAPAEAKWWADGPRGATKQGEPGAALGARSRTSAPGGNCWRSSSSNKSRITRAQTPPAKGAAKAPGVNGEAAAKTTSGPLFQLAAAGSVAAALPFVQEPFTLLSSASKGLVDPASKPASSHGCSAHSTSPPSAVPNVSQSPCSSESVPESRGMVPTARRAATTRAKSSKKTVFPQPGPLSTSTIPPLPVASNRACTFNKVLRANSVRSLSLDLEGS